MAELIAPLPRATLISGMTIAFEAIHPDTGAPVANVVVSKVAVYADALDLADIGAGPEPVDLPDVAPLWAPLPVEAS